MLAQNESIFAPVSQVNYQYYLNKDEVLKELKHNNSVQCIVGNYVISFGQAQKPCITDYADSVDTMKFLKGLS